MTQISLIQITAARLFVSELDYCVKWMNGYKLNAIDGKKEKANKLFSYFT